MEKNQVCDCEAGNCVLIQR